MDLALHRDAHFADDEELLHTLHNNTKFNSQVYKAWIIIVEMMIRQCSVMHACNKALVRFCFNCPLVSSCPQMSSSFEPSSQPIPKKE